MTESNPLLSLPVRSPQELVPVQLPESGSGKATSKDAARMFEGLLMTQLFQAMRKTIEPSGLFGENKQARSTYEYLLDQSVVEHAMASGKGWGLADKLEKDWVKSKKAEPQTSART